MSEVKKIDPRLKKIKIKMAELGLNNKQLGEKVGVSGATVTTFFETLSNGGKPHFAKAKRYADVLGLDIEEIL